MDSRYETAVERLSSEKQKRASLLNMLPVFTTSAPWDFYDAGDGATLFMYNGVSKADFEGYCAEIGKVGFEEYATCEIGDNQYATFVKGAVTVDAWRIGYASEMRVTIQENIPLLPKVMPCEAHGKVQPALVALGGHGDFPGMTGMEFIMRLENGGFMVMDGGADSKMWENTYRIMREMAIDPENITIESWIFTHSHDDHIAAFTQFAEAYDAIKDHVTLKSVIANFAAPEQAGLQGLDWEDKIIRDIMADKLSDVPFYKVHPGNVCQFPGMRFEFLGTHESFTGTENGFPYYYNACNLLIKTTVEAEQGAKQVIMFEGDNDARNNVILGKTYGDYLKCDILQADHHGNFGGVVEVNELFSPSVILFCNYYSEIPKYFEADYNQTLLRSPDFKEYIVTDYKAHTMMLPYVPGTSTSEALRG